MSGQVVCPLNGQMVCHLSGPMDLRFEFEDGLLNKT